MLVVLVADVLIVVVAVDVDVDVLDAVVLVVLVDDVLVVFPQNGPPYPAAQLQLNPSGRFMFDGQLTAMQLAADLNSSVPSVVLVA